MDFSHLGGRLASRKREKHGMLIYVQREGGGFSEQRGELPLFYTPGLPISLALLCHPSPPTLMFSFTVRPSRSASIPPRHKNSVAL